MDFGVFGPNVGHALTLWGINTDDSGNYVGVWVTDSDNDKGGAEPRLNTLDYYKVSWSGADWYLQNFYGRNDIYIDDSG